MVSELALGGHRDSTFAVPDTEELTACLICMILSVKKAKSLQALVDRSSEATDTGGLVSLTVANKARALFLFFVMMSENKDCRAFFIS